jgi:hypothetical protein
MKSTSAIATENKLQRLAIEKLNFAFTGRVDYLEMTPEKSRGRFFFVYNKVLFFFTQRRFVNSYQAKFHFHF